MIGTVLENRASGGDNPVRYRDENGDGAGDFIKGFCAAVLDNANIFSPKNSISEAIPRGNEKHYSLGQTAGHVASVIIGGTEIVQGLSTTVASGVVTVGSAGTTSLLTVPTALIGAVEATHGTLMVAKSLSNLSKQVSKSNEKIKASTVPNENSKKTDSNKQLKKRKASSESEYSTSAEHTANARPSTKNKHQEAESRRNRDKGGEKGDQRRRRYK